MFNKLPFLFTAIRPVTLLAGIAPVILGLALSFNTLEFFNNKSVALITLICTIFMQIGTNLVNDYYDIKDGIDNESRLGPNRVNREGGLSLKQVNYAFRASFVISFLLGLYLMYLGGIVISFIGLSSLLAAYCYTAGPFPLSRNALGEVTAFIFFGPVAVCGTYYLQVHQIHLNVIIASFLTGFISAAIMSINNLRDRVSDKAVNKSTLAVFLSENNARALPIIFIFLSSTPSLYFLFKYQNFFYILPSVFPLLFIKNWVRILKGPIDSELNLCLKNTGKFLFLSTLIHSFILCL